jgi:hypothetical protein
MRIKTSSVTLAALIILFLTPGRSWGQEVLYEEHFTGGTTDLQWESAFFDSLGNPLTPMEVDSVGGNPSGDGWVGIVHSDTLLGNLGLAVAGDSSSLTDYSMEAQIWIKPNTGFYNGIMMRANADTAQGKARGYQLVYSPFLNTLKFRYYVSIPDSIVTIREWDSTEIPGGAVTSPSWHKMKIDAQGDLFFCYWDDQLLPDSPLVDETRTRGNFGIYCFDMFGPTQVLCDDIIVEGQPQGVGEEGKGAGLPRAFNLSQNFPNPFNPMTTIRVNIPDDSRIKAALTIYDIRGRLVRTLAEGPLTKGTHSYAWDGRDDSGRPVPSGTYIYRLTRGSDRSIKKMILAK